MHFHASPKSTELPNKSLSILNMQEVSDMIWYQSLSLWFKNFMGATKDYSYFFEEEDGGGGGGQEQKCRTIFWILFSDHSIVLNTVAGYSNSGRNRRLLFYKSVYLKVQ